MLKKISLFGMLAIASISFADETVGTGKEMQPKKEETTSSQKVTSQSVAVALANLPHISSDKLFSVSGSYGLSNNNSAGAIGFSGNALNNALTYRVSGALNQSLDYGFGVGFSYNFGANHGTKVANFLNNTNEDLVDANGQKSGYKTLNVNYGSSFGALTQGELLKMIKDGASQMSNDKIELLTDRVARLEEDNNIFRKDFVLFKNQTRVQLDILANETQALKNKDIAPYNFYISDYNKKQYLLFDRQMEQLDILLPHLIGKDITIIGYGDVNSSSNSNLRLAYKRANEVRFYYKNKGINSIRIVRSGFKKDVDTNKIEIVVNIPQRVVKQ